MDADTSAAWRARWGLAGDGCLINAAVFAALTSLSLLLVFVIFPGVGGTEASGVGMGILSIVLTLVGGVGGPALTWYLHGRRFHAAPVIGAVLGLALSLVAVPVLGLLAWLLSMAVRPISTAEWAGPLALLILVSAAFMAVIVWRLVDAFRDLAPARSEHRRLDIVRIVSAAVLLTFAIGVGIAASRPGQGEMAEAPIFAIAAGIAGAGMMVGADLFDTLTKSRKEESAHPTVA